MGASASTSSSAAFSPKKYDVFISFRGQDTRANFTSHLHTALSQKSIRTYIDYELPKGDQISPSLLQAIEDSSVSVVVLSEDYASSKWCLDELTKILQCKKDEGQIVIPVFYKVDPSDVRKQNGTYKEAIAKHERHFNHDKVNEWKAALFETANLAGWDSRAFRDEAELIRNIVDDVLQKLDIKYPNVLKGLVGIEENCERIELLLERAPVIGILGMGGIGKTTMARAVFAKLYSQFESSCFLENLREESEKHGLTYIRDKLLLELLKEDNLPNSTSKVVGSTFVMRRLSCKKVFIVLDDVSSSKQLEYLAGECDCLGQGSRVIITTRNKHLLIGRVNEIYEARALSYHESLKLFYFKAFHKDHPEIGYEQLSERAVLYAKGIPLALVVLGSFLHSALVVLGSFLHSKTIAEWESALKKLKKTPNEDIQKVLKLSYDELNYEEKEMFLEIACFLNGEVEEHVITLLDSYGFHARIGLRTLVDKALITIEHTVLMHDLIQEMGWEIVQQECIKDPGRRSRLWDPKEIYDVLKYNQGTDTVEGIMLDVSQINDLHLNADTFKRMTKLRYLKIFSPCKTRSCHVNLPTGLEFPDKLRYLCWDGYPLKSLPSNFCPENVVELRMEGSWVKKLWEGVQDFVNLKVVFLGESKCLIELPDFSKSQNLEIVNLSYCESLCHVHPSILSLPSLSDLNLLHCKELKSLQSENHLKSLQHLSVDGCFNLKEFSLSSEELTRLFLQDTGIEILDSSIGRLSKLRMLDLNGSTIKILPTKELCNLRSLQDLKLFKFGQVLDKSKLHILFDSLCSLLSLSLVECTNLSELPENISSLSLLSVLELDGTNVERLPYSIKHLSKLEIISLRDCERLRSLPELPPFIRALDATNCTSLEAVFTLTTSTLAQKENETYLFRFGDCMKLNEHSLRGIVDFAQFSLKRASYNNFKAVSICYAGSKVPEWFRFKQTAGASITIDLPPDFNDLLGFIFCSVVSEFTSKEIVTHDPGCILGGDSDELYSPYYSSVWCYEGIKELNSNHVFLWYDPNYCKYIMEEVKRRGNDQGTINNPQVSFKFPVVTAKLFQMSQFDFGLTKACGVCPMYASDYHKFLQQTELELKLGTKAKRCRDTDEQEQLPHAKKLKESLIVQPVPLGLELESCTVSKKSQNIEELVHKLSELELESLPMRTKRSSSHYFRPKESTDRSSSFVNSNLCAESKESTAHK